jgi:hypothetical protein
MEGNFMKSTLLGTETDRDSNLGMWRDVSAWVAQTKAVVEKTIDPGYPDTIPVSGYWTVKIEIPCHYDGLYGSAMEDALSLLHDVGSKPDEAYLDAGFCILELRRLTFDEARFRSGKARSWLCANGYAVNWGKYARWTRDVPARIRLTRDERFSPAGSNWGLAVSIPEEAGGDQAGQCLAAHLEMTSEHQEGARAFMGFGAVAPTLQFTIGDFETAKAKAKKAISFLSQDGRHVHTSWGDERLPLDALSEEALRSLYRDYRDDGYDFTLPRVDLIDLAGNQGSTWSVIRSVAARTYGVTEEMEMTLSRCEVYVMRDAMMDLKNLCGEVQFHAQFADIYGGQNDLLGYFDDAHKAYEILTGIITKLNWLLGYRVQRARRETTGRDIWPKWVSES